MAGKLKPRKVTKNEFMKIRFYGGRLTEILDRDFPNAAVGSFRDRVKGSEDYLIGAAIEALGLVDLFFDKE